MTNASGTVYPGAIDTFSQQNAQDEWTYTKYNVIASAITAIETKVDAGGSGGGGGTAMSLMLGGM